MFSYILLFLFLSHWVLAAPRPAETDIDIKIKDLRDGNKIPSLSHCTEGPYYAYKFKRLLDGTSIKVCRPSFRAPSSHLHRGFSASAPH